MGWSFHPLFLFFFFFLTFSSSLNLGIFKLRSDCSNQTKRPAAGGGFAHGKWKVKKKKKEVGKADGMLVLESASRVPSLVG